MTTTPNAYEEKQERRRERLLERADNADREASQRLGTAQRMASVIPFGQPILVGHHSETRDRNYRRKIRNNYDKSREASEKAKRLHDRAASVGKGGISSDDPEAVKKLVAKIETAEKLQGFMKRCNAAIRKRKKDGGAAFATICDEHNLGPDTRADLLKPDYAGRIGFAPYQLSNNNANIRRMKRRVEALRAQAQERERIRKSADATPEKSPGSEKGEMVQANDGHRVRRSHRGGDRGGEPRTQPKTET